MSFSKKQPKLALNTFDEKKCYTNKTESVL